MFSKQNLVSFHILERGSKQCNLVTWTYPTIFEETKTYVTSRCFSTAKSTGTTEYNVFFYLRRNNFWIYIKEFIYKKNVNALVVIAEDYAPCRYKVLCDILAKKYLKTNNPADLVKLYLKLFTSGSVSCQENGTDISFDLKKFKTETKVKDVIKDFGLEIVLIYAAILLKRRIFVYHHDIEKLQQKMMAMVDLVPVRDPKDYLYPLVESINELKGSTFYLAGTNNENASNSDNYFDLHVDLLVNEIIISKRAKDCFAMAKIHKDIAHFLVQLSESDLRETAVVEQIKTKTLDILKQLNCIATCETENKKMVSLNDLKSKNFNPALENFLFNLAVAENMMML